MKFQNLLTNNPYWVQIKTAGVVILAVLLFAAGWVAHKKWTKPVTRVVEVPIHITNPDHPQVDHSNGVIEPAIHTVPHTQMPVAPDHPIDNPTSTTVIEVPVLVPQTVRVFHQNRLDFSEQKDGYSVWVDSRIWATDEKGQPILGLKGETLFNKDAKLFITKTITEPKEHPWCVGGIYAPVGPNRGSYGLFVDYDLAFLRLGVEAINSKIELPSQRIQQTQTLVKVGVRF